MRRFAAPSTIEQIPGGYKVLDSNGQSLAYVYGRETKSDADIANVLTMDEARRIASNITKLPKLLGETDCGLLGRVLINLPGCPSRCPLSDGGSSARNASEL